MRLIVTIGKFLLTLMVFAYFLTIAAGLISADDTTGALSGIAIAVLAGLVAFLVAPGFYHAFRRDWKSYRGLFAVAILLMLSACTRIDAGHVGIKVELAGSQRGVSDFPLKTGWVLYNPLTASVFQWPTFVQTAVWTANPNEGKPVNEELTFSTGDQMKVSVDVSIAYHLEAEKVPHFYVKFRNANLDQFTHGFLRNLAREKFDNIAGKYRIEQIMGDNAQFLKEVRDALQREVAPVGVIFDQFGIIGVPRPPQQVIESINAKVQAVQNAIRTENELRQSEAEAKKVVAQADGAARAIMVKAKAEAEANELISRSLTPALVHYKMIDRWNGQRPMVEGGSSGVLLQMPQVGAR